MIENSLLLISQGNTNFQVIFLITTVALLFMMCKYEEMQFQSLQRIGADELICRHTQSVFPLTENESSKIVPYRIAVGIFTVERPRAPDFLYAEVYSILDTLIINQQFFIIDKIHVFDGTIGGNGSQVKYLKYSKHVEVHPLREESLLYMKSLPGNRRKASYNYLRTLQYLYSNYERRVDAYLVLEDDVIFDPNAAFILWEVLIAVRHLPRYLVDGYNRGRKNGLVSEVMTKSPVYPFLGFRKCCSQSYLISPEIVQIAMPLIEKSLNGSTRYQPLDLHLTSSLFFVPKYRFFLSRTCWVQHIGYPYLGLGRYHRGCSRMDFGFGKNQLQNLSIVVK